MPERERLGVPRGSERDATVAARSLFHRRRTPAPSTCSLRQQSDVARWAPVEFIASARPPSDTFLRPLA